jgi:hypothetical protein
MRSLSGLIVASLTVVLAVQSNASAGVIWYSSESPSGGWSHLYSIDTATQAITDRGVIQSQRYVTDLAIDANGKLYGVGWTDAQASSSRTFRITPGAADTIATWEIVEVKSQSMDRTVNAAVIKDGSMYVASALGTFQQLSYDPSRDRWQVARTAAMNYHAGGDLAFSADGQTLYVTLDTGALGTVNFDALSNAFGHVAVIGQTGYSQVFGLAQTGGVLYGFTNNSTNYGNSYLVMLDPVTGRATDPVPLNVPVWGAAAAGQAPGGSVPEPMTVALLGLGGLCILGRRHRRWKPAIPC